MKVVPSARIPANAAIWRLRHLTFVHISGEADTGHPLIVVTHMKIQNNALRLSAIALACLSVFASVHAQTPDKLETIVVTASRTETRSDELVSDVVVVTREQIEQSSGRSLPEVLARMAGVQFSASGGLGKSASVYIRGAEARHTLLLIDGVRFGSATTGTPSWENIPLDMIERIEVLKGPASALYGSDAAGGVVQIFMRKGAAGFRATGALTVGSNSFSQLSAGFNGASAELSYSLGLQRVRDDGFSATNAAVPFGSFNPDADGFKQDAINASLRWTFVPGWAFDVRLLNSKGKVQFDDGPLVDTRGSLATTLTSVGVEGRVTSGWKSRLSYAVSADKSTQLSSASSFTTVPSNFDTRQTQLTWKNDVVTPVGVALLGIEQLEQAVSSTTAYTVKSRKVSSVFAGISGSSGAHSWQANLRRDSNSQFGKNSTGFVGYAFAFTPNWRVNASHGTSFVAPSFNQLYFPRFGNALLQPERGRNSEIGVTYSDAGHSVKLVRFDNKIRGFISATTLPANIPRARIDGWTISYDGQFGALAVRAAHDSFDPRNELTGKLLPRRNRSQTSLALDYSAGAYKIGGQLLSAGARFDNTANTLRLDGYSTLDVNAEYKLAADWVLHGKVVNVTDRNYQTVLGYNQPGRGVFVGVRYQPK
jgi:vitamin B12 transporter